MLTTYYPNDQPYIVEQRVNGIRNGEVKIYNATGQEISIIWYGSSRINSIEYQQNNTRHNEHGPAYMSWYDNVQPYFIEYRQNDKLHNEHGPAHMVWYDNLQVCHISYWQNGIRHNLHGPDYILWYTLIEKIEYHYFGKLIKEYRF